MSNEKLGAEQAYHAWRELGEAFNKYREIEWPYAPNKFTAVELAFEAGWSQAYHARGAGRESHNCENCGEAITNNTFTCSTCWNRVASSAPDHARCARLTSEQVREAYDWALSVNKSHPSLFAGMAERLNAALREPGADTGTTPPRIQCASCNSVHTTQYENAGGVKMYVCTCGWHQPVPERGTTPPEGLAGLEQKFREWAMAEGEDYAEQAYKNCADAVRDIRAATQRAPVEQGRGEVRCDNCGEDTELDQCPKCGNGLKARREKLRGAPDHAREGALRGLVAKWRGLRGVDWSAEPDGWKVTFNVCADELERALADGKEGGE